MQYPYHSAKCASQCPSRTRLRKPLRHVDVKVRDSDAPSYGCHTPRPDLGHVDVILPDLISDILDVVLPGLWTLGARYIVLALLGQFWLKAEGRQDKIPQSVPNRRNRLDLIVDGANAVDPSSSASKKPLNMVVPTDNTTMA